MHIPISYATCGGVRTEGTDTLCLPYTKTWILPGYWPGNTKMPLHDDYGLPEIVMDILKHQKNKENVQLKYKLYSSGNYTELKLQWIAMDQCLPNKVSEGLPERQWGPRYNNNTGRPWKYKPPSAYRRDAARKKQYLQSKRKTSADVGTQSETDKADCAPVMQNIRLTRSKSKVSKEADVIERPRNSSINNKSVDISVCSITDDQSDTSLLLSPTSDGLNPTAESCAPSPGDVPCPEDFNNSDVSIPASDDSDVASLPQLDETQDTSNQPDNVNYSKFAVFMTCHFKHLEGTHFDHYEDMLFCDKCKIIMCKLCKYQRPAAHNEHLAHLKWISHLWSPEDR